MPDLGNLSLSSSLTLTPCSDFKSLTDPPDQSLVKPLSVDCFWDQRLKFAALHSGEVDNGGAIKVFRRSRSLVNRTKKASNSKSLENRVNDWFSNRVKLGVPESRCSLPFLYGAKKLGNCLICQTFVHSWDKVSCSVRKCPGIYHGQCLKERLGISDSNMKKFKCLQHACFICRQRLHWRCVRCTVAAHDKCAPWPNEVIHLNDQPGKAICWRHPADWRQDRKHAVSTTSMEEVFCRLPLPYIDEEFKIELTWKDTDIALEPPPYLHIRRNVYLVKKKRDIFDDDVGCTCTSTCSEECVCRGQCISCSKACHCSENCTNRPFSKEKKIKIVKTEHCGWGAEAAEHVKKGDFIIEYVGEVIDDALCERRLWDMKYQEVKNFYMCEIQKDFTIDATFKGNPSRFLNHSCDPNCVLEKWQVDGETRVGVFSARSVQVGEPLTYDYRFVQFGPEVQCRCGAPNCQGYLGTKRKIDKVSLCWGSKRKRTATAFVAIVPT